MAESNHGDPETILKQLTLLTQQITNLMANQVNDKNKSFSDLMERFPKLDDENNDFDQLSRAFASEFQELEKLAEDQKRAIVLAKLSKESRIRLENMLPSGKTLADIVWKSSDSSELTLYKTIKQLFGKKKNTLISIYDILNGSELENIDEIEHAAATSRFVELEQKMITTDTIKIILSIQTIKNEKLKEAMGSKLKRGKFTTFKDYYTILEDNLEKDVIQVNRINVSEKFERKSMKKFNIPQELLVKCLRCGEEGHFADKCSAVNLSCTLCRRKNHINKTCFTQFNNKIVRIYTVVSSSKCFLKSFKLKKDYVVDFLVDSSADRSFLDIGVVKKINQSQNIKRIDFDVVDYNGNQVELLGEWYSEDSGIYFLITKRLKNILGRDWMEKVKYQFPYEVNEIKMPINNQRDNQEVVTDDVKNSEFKELELKYTDYEELDNIVNINHIETSNNLLKQMKEEFEELFRDEIGCIKDFEVKLELIQPDQTRLITVEARRIPYSHRIKVEEYFKNLEKQGVVKEVKNPSWYTPIVIVQKADGGIRICPNYSTGLNDYIKDYNKMLKPIEELISEIKPYKIWSNIDVHDAYLSFCLENTPKQYTTCCTHNAFYQYERLPFGIKIASGLLQSYMEDLLKNLSGVYIYQDDILCGSFDLQSHNILLKEVLSRLQKVGFRLKASKCAIGLKSVKFLGYEFDERGKKIDNQRIEPILKMGIPRNCKEVISLMGSLSYYGNFLKNLHIIKEPFLPLLKKNATYFWNSKMQESLKMIKDQLSEEIHLSHIDPKAELLLISDSSDLALGGSLNQIWNKDIKTIKPLGFFSKTLNSHQQLYPMVEKEGLALITGIKKYDLWLSSRKFCIMVDNQALFHILSSNKGISKTGSRRLARWN